jgi:hypothetical protein
VDRWVEAVVVSTNAPVERGRLEAEKVTVVSAMAILPYIENRRVRLSPAEVDRTQVALMGAQYSSSRT